MKRTFNHLVLLLVALALVGFASPRVAFADSAAVTNVQSLISALDVHSLSDRESVVFARRAYDKLSSTDKTAVTNLAGLQAAEAWVLRYWIEDIYTRNPAAPIDEARAVGIWVVNAWYDGDEDMGLDPMNATQQAIIGTHDHDLLVQMTDYAAATYGARIKADYAIAKTVATQINAMDPDNPTQVTAARAAYDALTPMQKAAVPNLDVLKRAEGTNSVIPANITMAGGRAPTNGNGYTIAQWQTIADTMKSDFPAAAATNIWIAGMLSTSSALPQGGINIGVSFDSIKDADGKYAPPGYTPLTLAEWNAKNITFSQSSSAKATHEQFLTYFDEHGISVYLQVESGFADMVTLMDIYKDVFHVQSHPSVKGFAVDVEWYYGVDEDMGLPVTDERAQQWNEHLRDTWGAGHDQLLLKHYDALRLPTTYRGGENGTAKLVFCDDTQSLGSLIGEVGGVYDDPAAKDGDVMGAAPEFRVFSSYFPNNDVVYQIGYSPDREWFDSLDTPIVQSLGVKLAEATNPGQHVGIVWVQSSFADSLNFPGLIPSQTSTVNGLLAYLGTSGSNNLVGERFEGTQGRTAPTVSDALFVKRMRDLVNALPPDQAAGLTGSRLARLVVLEPRAVDVRIQDMLDNRPDTSALHRFDCDKVGAIWSTYGALTSDQKAVVTKYAQFGPYLVGCASRIFVGPTAAISSPADGGNYSLNEAVLTSFSCTEADGAPGLASCVDSNGANAGVGALDTSTLGVHTYTITATSHDGLVGTASIGYTVGATALTVTGSVNLSVHGQAVTFTATVVALGAGAATPTGTVQFQVDGVNVGAPVAVDATGHASSAPISNLATGTRHITAAYSGSGSSGTSTSATYDQVVKAAATTTSVVSSLPTTRHGQPVTFKATVGSVAPGAGIPTGTVQFKVDGVAIGTPVAVDATGHAISAAISTLATGTRHITAVYSGSGDLATSTSASYNQVVNKAITGTQVAGTPNPSKFARSWTLEATVTTKAPGVGLPVGKVQFYIDGQKYGSAVVVNASGYASRAVTIALTKGKHTIRAVFLGNKDFKTSSEKYIHRIR